MSELELSKELNIIQVCLNDFNDAFISKLKADTTVVLMIKTKNKHGMAEQRRLFMKLMNANCDTPVIIGRDYENLSEEEFQLQASTDLGALLLDGLGMAYFKSYKFGNEQMKMQTAFGILQATRTRISKTEYISCPSCGRTLLIYKKPPQNSFKNKSFKRFENWYYGLHS
ncbi:MAG: hypothetical protein CM15mP23_04620 [Cryomorphaceae bacterium]|nr:MAG: hypothetical protein CM15mP23_04620 [Cryomorphaceae bacterium]